MNIWKSAPHLGVLAATVMFAGSCSNGPSTSPGSSLNSAPAGMRGGHPLSVSLYDTVRPFTVHKDLRKSWVSTEAKRRPRLLFVSDAGTDDVYIFSMPVLGLKGTITGFNEPQGLCSDNSGNIWVTNLRSAQILQYSREGSLLNTLNDPTGYPIGCAVDPTTGNLAVANSQSFDDHAGSVLIYPGATGTPLAVTSPSVEYYYFAGYDDSGNLFFDGRDFAGNFILSEATPGNSVASTISISGGTIYFPGMVEWNRKAGDLVIGDQLCGGTATSCLYSVSISGSSGTITGTTNLSTYLGGAVCDVAQAVLGPYKQKFVATGGDWEYCGYATSSTYRWPFPAGGSPTNYNNSIVQVPAGAAISNK